MDIYDFIVPKEKLEARMKQCKGCPYHQPGLFSCLGFKHFDKCGMCGCFLKAKARLKDAACPVGVW